jgi:hypothetical protein
MLSSGTFGAGGLATRKMIEYQFSHTFDFTFAVPINSMSNIARRSCIGAHLVSFA